MDKGKPLYDLLIIGGGPIGLACALEAQKAGLIYVIIEKGSLVNSIYRYPFNMNFFSTSERLEIGGSPFISVNPKPNRNEALEYYRRVAESRSLTVRLFEEVLEVTPAKKNVYNVQTNKGRYLSKNIIIAIGFYDIPVLLGVEGENLPKVTHYYKEPHFYYRQKVVVVGANNSSVDAALETFRKGAEVTMVIRGSEIGQRVKYWARPDIVNRIKEGSIKAYFHAALKEIHPHQVDIQTPEGEITIENDYVIAATGYQPNFAFLEKMGIRFSQDGLRLPEYNTETQESNMPGIYLAGVVCGGMNTHVWFIENSRVHAQQIITHIQDNAFLHSI